MSNIKIYNMYLSMLFNKYLIVIKNVEIYKNKLSCLKYDRKN